MNYRILFSVHRTIIYLSIVYVIGHVVKAVGAIPDVGDNTIHVYVSFDAGCSVLLWGHTVNLFHVK